MSKRNFSKEFKLRLINEHDEEGVSFYKLDKDNHLAFAGEISRYTNLIRIKYKFYELFSEYFLICPKMNIRSLPLIRFQEML